MTKKSGRKAGTFIGGMGDLMGAGAATTITNGTFLLAIP